LREFAIRSNNQTGNEWNRSFSRVYTPLSRINTSGLIPKLVRKEGKTFWKNRILHSSYKQVVLIKPNAYFRRQIISILRGQLPSVSWDPQDLYPTTLGDTPEYQEYLDKCQVDVFMGHENLMVLSPNKLSVEGNVIPLKQPACLLALMLLRLVPLVGTKPDTLRHPLTEGCELCARIAMKSCVHQLRVEGLQRRNRRNRITPEKDPPEVPWVECPVKWINPLTLIVEYMPSLFEVD
jgi:hypothetical protein